MVAALAEIRHLGCSFIVGGREDGEGVFLTLDGVLERSGLPESIRGEKKPTAKNIPQRTSSILCAYPPQYPYPT